MALNYVTLILNVVDGSGSPASRGWASVAPSAQLTDATNNAEVIPPVTVQFAAAASPTVRLLATDNPTVQPPGWAWTITFQTVPGNPASYNFALPAGPQTFTATNAAPAVFTGSGAGYLNNTAVQLSGGSLPAGFTAGTTYWVVGASGSAFQLAAAVGGPPLGSTSTGSGSVVATQSYLSTLSPVAPVTTMAGYLPLPSGTPAAGQAPLATGSGEASAWGNVAANPMTTAGDTVYGGAAGAMTRLAGDTSNTRKFLREQSSGGVAQPPAWDTITAGDVPTLNQNTTGTAANVTATLDQIPAPGAAVSLNSKKITSLANGTASTDAAAFGQTPAGGTTATIGQGGTGQVTAAAAYNALSPMTTTGDLEYESGANTASRLAGNTSATKNFLTQTGTGSVSAAPAWGTIAAGDLPAANTSTQGAVILDGTAADIQPDGVQAAGNSTKSAAANHVHQNNADLSLYLAPSGATGETFSRALCGGYTSALVSGQSYVSAIPLPAGLAINNLGVMIGSTAFATVTHGWLALLDSGRVVRAVTADQTTSFQTSFANLSLAASGGYTTTYGGLYYLVICVVAGTMGTISAGTAPLSAPNATVPILAGTSAGSLTTPPATSTTMAAITANGAWRFYGYTA